MLTRQVLVGMVSIFYLWGTPNISAQIATSDPLYQKMMQLDSLIFEESFNNCRVEVLYEVTDADFEFYHDQSGTTFGQEPFVEGIRKNICSLEYRPLRKLTEGSMAVYPLYSNGQLYGAIQMGEHSFYAREAHKAPYLTSTAKFTHLWIKVDDRWVIRRVLSFDHQSP